MDTVHDLTFDIFQGISFVYHQSFHSFGFSRGSESCTIFHCLQISISLYMTGIGQKIFLSLCLHFRLFCCLFCNFFGSFFFYISISGFFRCSNLVCHIRLLFCVRLIRRDLCLCCILCLPRFLRICYSRCCSHCKSEDQYPCQCRRLPLFLHPA